MELEEYLSHIQEARKNRFESIRKLIKRLFPKAKESMRYRMPTFEFKEGWVALANQKNYISFYTCGLGHIAKFKKDHPEYKTGKGCINFRHKDEITLKSLQVVIKSAMEYRH